MEWIWLLHGKIEHTCNINLIVCFSPPRLQGRFRLEEIFFLILSLVKVLSVWFKKKNGKTDFFFYFLFLSALIILIYFLLLTMGLACSFLVPWGISCLCDIFSFYKSICRYKILLINILLYNLSLGIFFHFCWSQDISFYFHLISSLIHWLFGSVSFNFLVFMSFLMLDNLEEMSS